MSITDSAGQKIQGRRKLRRFRSPEWRAIRDREIVSLSKQGYTRAEVGEAVDLSPRQVIRRINLFKRLNPRLEI